MTPKQPAISSDDAQPDNRIASLYRRKSVLARRAMPKFQHVRAINYARAMLGDLPEPDLP